ncbi:hypothetical protein RAS1_21760 [Phycisphaerae bacterium RAS1]|nr:hypothetical protein RAS1_21760 [Phycisphaerae bacterium RAS1]
MKNSIPTSATASRDRFPSRDRKGALLPAASADARDISEMQRGQWKNRLLTGAALTATVLLASASTLAAENKRPVTVHVIGFGVDANTTAQLTNMAAAGGGRYFPAANEAELTHALGSAIGVQLAPTASNENEGNNSIGTPTVIASGASVSGKIDPVGDADFYTLDLDQQGRLDVHITPPPGLDIVVRVLNADGADLSGWIAPLAAGGETTGAVNIPARGTYIVQLGDNRNDAASPQPYTLELRFAAGDANEPNGSAGRATLITPGTDAYGSILPVGDQDWYAFDVPRLGAATIRFSQMAPEVDLHFRVLNSERADISGWLAPLKAGADNQAVVDLPAAGRYYIESGDGRNDAGAPAPYRLDLSYDAGDAAEPNNSAGAATRIEPNAQLLASILPRGDQDWFAFTVDHPGIVEVALTGVPAELDLHFRVLSPDWVDISGWVAPLRAGADNVAIVDLPTRGTYYLCVTDGKNDARAAACYALQLRYSRADDHEPNATIGAATEIGIGQDVSGSILPLRDVDCYSFELSQAGSAQISLTNVAPELDLVFRVLNAERVDVSGWKAPLRAGAETTAKVDLKAPGRYYLEVADAKNDARSTAPYTLRVTAP